MSTETRIVNAWADYQGQITAFVPTGAGVRVVKVRGEYVCYLRASDVSASLAHMLRASSHVAGITTEGEWLRVRWRTAQARDGACDPREGWFAKQGIPTFEGDVPPLRRWMIDNAVQIARPRRAYFDIETCARVPLSRKEESRLLCWTLMDDAGNTQTGVLEADTDEAERALLQEFWRALESTDQVLAWNGDRFDFPVIFARSKLHGLSLDAHRWLWLDHMELFRRMNTASAESGEEKQSLSLQSVGMSVLREGKIEGFGPKEMFPSWEAGGEKRAALVEYNVRDVDLMRRIEAKTGYADLLNTLCEVTGVPADTAGIQPLPQVESFMFRLALEHGQHFETRAKPKFDDEAEKFKGAFVMEPTLRGIGRDVHVADFASMYPSIILSWNMSPETLRDGEAVDMAVPRELRTPWVRPEGQAQSATGALFVQEPSGLLPLALEHLLALRKEWNDKKAALPPGTSEWVDADRRSTAYKIAANSFYGVVGASVSRLYKQPVAESVSQTGAWLIRQTIEHAKAWKLDTVYGDTDSIFVRGCDAERFRAFVDSCNSELYPRLLKERGCAANRIKIAYEKQFDRIVFVSAKRYAGRYAHYKGSLATAASKPEVKGLEYKRGDGTRLARRLQAEVIDLLMGGGVEVPAGLGEPSRRADRREECDEDVRTYMALVEKYRAAVLEGPLDLSDVMQSKRLSKGIDGYATKAKKDGSDGTAPPHVRVAKILRERGSDVREGSRIEYIVLDGTTTPKTVVPAEDWAGECDRHELWESCVWPPTARLLASAFPVVNWDERYGKSRPAKPRERRRVVEVAEPTEGGAIFSLTAQRPPHVGGRGSRTRKG